MINLQFLIIIVAIILLILMAVAVIVLAYLYFSLRSQLPHRIQGQYQVWRENEIETIRKQQSEEAMRGALIQLKQWREQEIDLVRKQQLEVAKSEAFVQFEQWKTQYTFIIRQEAIQKSQAVTIGKVTEHFIPYLPDFIYNPKDARFLGSPIDFVVFDGLDEGEVKGIIFVEVKTGASSLNTRERKIRDAVKAGKIEWVELRPLLEINQPAQATSNTVT